MKKVIIDGNKVRRVPEPRGSVWTVPNVIGALGIVAFIVWGINLVIGGR